MSQSWSINQGGSEASVAGVVVRLAATTTPATLAKSFLSASYGNLENLAANSLQIGGSLVGMR